MKLVIKDDGAEARPKWGDLVGCVVEAANNTAYFICSYNNRLVQLVRIDIDAYAGCLEYKTNLCPNHFKIYRNVTITAERD